MAYIPAGTFVMGTDSGASYEGPAHEARTDAFFLDRTEVTNEAFAMFVAATHHVTVAEQHGNSLVFDVAQHRWTVVDGASWQHPEGAGSSVDATAPPCAPGAPMGFGGAAGRARVPAVEGRARHPVVHVAWADAAAYCAWRGGRLPTETEWERAAHGTLDARARFPWGDGLALADGRAAANTWQGKFPDHDDGSDGFRGTAPVGSFAPTSFGLYDMAGNVWEWTADRFDAHSDDRAIRGGSWLCSPEHCIGFRIAARGHAAPDEPTNHVGFRCLRSVVP
jgi:formylglycine-generating enzyme required for sulfatase activity